MTLEPVLSTEARLRSALDREIARSMITRGVWVILLRPTPRHTSADAKCYVSIANSHMLPGNIPLEIQHFAIIRNILPIEKQHLASADM